MTYLDRGPDQAHSTQVLQFLLLYHFIFMQVIKVQLI